MDWKHILHKIKTGWLTFWRWLKPYLQQFHQWRKRVWKKYHVNKIFILLSLVAILIMSGYLFYIAKNTKVSELESGLKESTVIFDANGDEAGCTRKKARTFLLMPSPVMWSTP